MHPSRMIRHYAVATSLWLFATACNMGLTSLDLSGPPGYCGFGLNSDKHPCVELELYPRVGEPGSALLKGDTLRMSTYSELGYGTPVTWSISGAAVAAVPASERELPGVLSYARASILVKGIQLGSATVTAAHANPARTASSTITVVDSTIIAQIVLSSYHEDPSLAPISTTNVSVGDSLYVVVTLMDAAGRGYTAKPELWSTTDTTVASIARHQTAPPASFVQTYARARSPGTVDVIASFLTVRGTLRITVVP